jgi:hypothetical protein
MTETSTAKGDVHFFKCLIVYCQVESHFQLSTLHRDVDLGLWISMSEGLMKLWWKSIKRDKPSDVDLGLVASGQVQEDVLLKPHSLVVVVENVAGISEN